jgi:D-glycero-D-manno-heptose 1,7-bisphosphate phosphatase
MTSRDLDAVHARMSREAEAAGGHVDALFACPHAPDAGCRCRKPAPGLIEDAVAASNLPPSQTLVVGDAGRDLEAAHAAGVAAALVLTGKGRAAADSLDRNEVRVYDDLLALAQSLIGAPRQV